MKKILCLLAFLPLLAQAQTWTIRDRFDTLSVQSVNSVRKSWKLLTGIDASTGALQINGDSTASPFNSTSGQVRGGSAWDSTMNDTSYLGIVVKQRLISNGFFTFIMGKFTTKDNNANGYRLNWNDYNGIEGIAIERITGGVNATTLVTKNTTVQVNDTLYLKSDSNYTYTAYCKHVAGGIDSVVTTDSTYKMKANWYPWLRCLIGSPPVKIKSFMTAPLMRIAPPPPPTSDTTTFSNMSTIPPGTVGQVPIVDSLQFKVSAQDLFSNLTKIVVRQDGVRKDSITGQSLANITWTSKRIFAGNRGATHTYDFIATSTIPNSYTSAQQTYYCLGDTGVTWFQVQPILSGPQDTVQLQITAFDYYGIKYLLAFLNGTQVDSIWYGLSPVTSNPTWTTKKLGAGTLNVTQNYYFKAVTDSSLSRTSPIFSYTPSNKKYRHIVHLENWFFVIAPSAVPYQYITNLILFDGHTFGRATSPGAPGYFEPPSNIQNTYWTQVNQLCHANGVKMELDLGTNVNSEYQQVCALGVGAMQTWAGTVSHYIIQFNLDGADFDAEGGQYPQNGGMGKMAQLLHDSLAALNPSKNYDITCSMMPNLADLKGYLTGNSGASVASVLTSSAYFTLISPMWYDQCFPLVDPLFKSTTHSCWSSDSGVVYNYVNAGVPKSQVGIGYAIQVYNGCSSCIFYMGTTNPAITNGPPSNIVMNGTHYFDNEAKSAWAQMGASPIIAYGDTNTGYWKAKFVKDNGFGGAMGFCVGRGYIANPNPGVDPNMAIRGVGQNLITSLPPPLPNPPVMQNPTGISSDTSRAIDTLTFAWSSVSGASSYDLLVSTDVNFNAVIIAKNVSNNFFTLAGSGITLQNGTYYWAKVDVTVGGQTSVFSTAVKFRTLLKTVSVAPTAPVLLQPAQGATGISRDFIIFKWSKNPASDSVTTYTYQLATDRLFSNIIWPAPQLAETTTTVSSLNYSTWYYWRVYAYKQNLGSVASVTDSFQTVIQITPPNPPTIWNPPNNSTGKAIDTTLFSWSPDVSATSYHIQISKDNLFTVPYVDLVITQATFTPGKAFKLDYNTLYYWRVQVSTSNGTSVYANAKMTTQQQPAAVNPLAPVLNTPTQGQTGLGTTITFSWTTLTSDSASSFQFIVGRRRNLDTTGLMGLDFNLVSPAPSQTNIGQQVISGLTASTWYYWQVQTNKGALKSVWSALDSFQTGSPPVVGKGSIFYTFGVDPNGGSAPVVTNPPFLTLQYQAGYVPPYLADTNAVQLIGRGTYRAGVFTPFGGSGSGGGITGVTASLPLASSLNNPPDISLVGIVPSANGGLGKGTWTNKSIPYFNGTTFAEDNNNLLYSVADTSLRVNRLYVDNTTGYIDRSALVTINRDDSTKHASIWSNVYIIEKSRGDSGQTFSGNGAIYLKTYEDTTKSGLTRRKRGVLYGITIDMAPYTENNPYTANMDVTPLVISNQGSVQGTEIIYMGGSKFIPHTAANPNGYAWTHGLRFTDTIQTGISFAGVQQYGIDFSGLGAIGSPNYAIYASNAQKQQIGTIQGGDASGNSLTLISTSHATKGNIFLGSTVNGRFSFDQVNDRVGIGVDAPQNDLTINGQANRVIWSERNTTSNTAGNVLTIQGGGATTGATDKNGGVMVVSGGIATGTGTSQVRFNTATPQASTSTTDNTPTVKMMIDGNGNVGINTTSPGPNNGGGVVLNIFSSSSTQIPELRINNTATSGSPDFNMEGKTSGGVATRFRITLNGDPAMMIGTISNHDMEFYTNNAISGRFTAAGLFEVGSATQFAVTTGGLISRYGNATPATGTFLRSDGTTYVTSTLTLPNAATTGDILTATASNAIGVVAVQATANKVLMSGASAVPTWSTPTFPNASATAGKRIISDGTNWIASTATLSDVPSTANKWLRSDGTNWITSTSTLSDAPSTAGKFMVSDGTNWITSTPTLPNGTATIGNYITGDGTNWVSTSGVGQASITAASAAINTTETVIVKTSALAANRLQAGTIIRVTLIGTCTSSAANTSTFNIRYGTAGTTSDALMQQAVTAVAAVTGTNIPFKVTFDITVRTTGSSATSDGMATLENQGATGISTTGDQVIRPTFTNFNTTTASIIISACYVSAATTTTSTFQDAYIEFVYK